MRFRATPIPRTVGSLNVGISLTRTAPAAATAAAPTTAGVTDASGPFIFSTGYVEGLPQTDGCYWLAVMYGIGAGADVVWTLAWNDMDGANADYVFSMVIYDSIIGIGTANSFAIEWIDVTATVNGVAYTIRIGPVPGQEGDNFACAS